MEDEIGIEGPIVDTSVLSDPHTEGAEADNSLSTRDIKRNMVFLVALDAIFATGWAEFQLALVPLLVFLGASNTMIGLVQGSLLIALPGIIISPWISLRYRKKRNYLILSNIPSIGMIGLAGVAVVFSHRLGIGSHSLLMTVAVLVVLHQFFNGFAALPHQEYIAACIPMSWRGRYTGFSLTAGSIVSMASAALGGWVLLSYEKPMSFGYLFLVTWIIAQSGYICAAFAKEVPTPVEKAPRPWSKDMLNAAKDDKPFVWFSLTHAFGVAFVAPMCGFVSVYAFKGLKMAAATAAVIAIVQKVGSISSSGVIGTLVDKLGAKNVYPVGWAIMGLSLIPVLLIPNAYGVYISSGVATIGGAAASSGYNALMYGLPSPENRSGHYTLMMMLIYAAAAGGYIVIGRASDLTSYRVVFTFGVMIALAYSLFLRCVVAPKLSDNAAEYG